MPRSCTEARKQQQEEREAEDDGYALPEARGMPLDERQLAHERGVGMAQIVDELGERLVALQRIRVDGLAQGGVDPLRDVVLVVQSRRVFQLALCGARAHLGGL